MQRSDLASPFLLPALLGAILAIWMVDNPVAAPYWLGFCAAVFAFLALVCGLLGGGTRAAARRAYKRETLGFVAAAAAFGRAERFVFCASQMGWIAGFFGIAALMSLALPGLPFLAVFLSFCFGPVAAALPAAFAPGRQSDDALIAFTPPEVLRQSNQHGAPLAAAFRLGWTLRARLAAARTSGAKATSAVPPEARDFMAAVDSGGRLRPPLENQVRAPAAYAALRLRGLCALIGPVAVMAVLAWMIVLALPKGLLPALPTPTELLEALSQPPEEDAERPPEEPSEPGSDEQEEEQPPSASPPDATGQDDEVADSPNGGTGPSDENDEEEQAETSGSGENAPQNGHDDESRNADAGNADGSDGNSGSDAAPSDETSGGERAAPSGEGAADQNSETNPSEAGKQNGETGTEADSGSDGEGQSQQETEGSDGEQPGQDSTASGSDGQSSGQDANAGDPAAQGGEASDGASGQTSQQSSGQTSGPDGNGQGNAEPLGEDVSSGQTEPPAGAEGRETAEDANRSGAASQGTSQEELGAHDSKAQSASLAPGENGAAASGVDGNTPRDASGTQELPTKESRDGAAPGGASSSEEGPDPGQVGSSGTAEAETADFAEPNHIREMAAGQAGEDVSTSHKAEPEADVTPESIEGTGPREEEGNPDTAARLRPDETDQEDRTLDIGLQGDYFAESGQAPEIIEKNLNGGRVQQAAPVPGEPTPQRVPAWIAGLLSN